MKIFATKLFIICFIFDNSWIMERIGKISGRTTTLDHSFRHFSPTDRSPRTDRILTTRSASVSPMNIKRVEGNKKEFQSIRVSPKSDLKIKTFQSRIKKLDEATSLGVKLSQHRESLEIKLKTHKAINEISGFSKCLKHDSTISVYNKNTCSLMCAVCHSKLMNSGYRNDVIPVDKSKECLYTDIKRMEMELGWEITTIKRIQDTLYQCFSQQLKSFESAMKMVDKKFQELAKLLKQKQEKIKNSLKQELQTQKLKHNIVIKEMVQLKEIIENNIGDNMPIKQEMVRGKEPQYTLTLFNKKYFSQQPMKVDCLSTQKCKYMSKLVYQHLILKQLVQSITFNKRGVQVDWTANKSNNMQMLVEQGMKEAWKSVSAFWTLSY